MGSFAVLTPSRGLVHSRTIEAVMANVAAASAAGHEFRGWRLTHDLPIPDCDNAVTEAGLATGAEALWFVEEDMVPADDALVASFTAEALIAAIDYPVGERPSWACISRDDTGHVYWCGLGATLIRREVFEMIERPWFRTDITYAIDRHPDGTRTLREMQRPSEYGGQDIGFFRRCLDAGIPITPVDGQLAGHARIRAMGRSGTNNGAHTVEIMTKIERQQWM
jgi:hypothetical protein